MIIKLILLFKYFFFIIPIEKSITNGIYKIFLDNNKYLLYKNKEFKFSFFQNIPDASYFRIIKINNDKYYYIYHLNTNLKLSGYNGNLDLNSNGTLDTNKWIFINSDNNKYIIQNKNQCYLILFDDKITCENNHEIPTKFNIKKIYEEVEHKEEDLELIEKEPIDVFIKYIDLTDKTLMREEIPQIPKEQDNEELKYNIRSILKNIPWVRKIFIVMPNKKVRYFKDYKLIKEKIIYIYDKDLIGFDSSLICAFHFRAWKMEKFNMSENFIILDDDYFIGKPLKKSDFFYVENGKVVPAIVSPKFSEITEQSANKDYDYYKKRITCKQTREDFFYSLSRTYLFSLFLFNRTLIIPEFTHNAIPCNTRDIKELYYIIYNSIHKNTTLFSLYRHIDSLQFQSFYMIYTFNKFNRKVNAISLTYIDNKDAILSNYNYSLFVINTGAYNYSSISFKKAKIVMEYLFSEPTPYEIIEYSNIASNAFNIVYSMEIDKNKKDNKIKKLLLSYHIFLIIIMILLTFIILLLILLFILLRKIKNNKYKILKEDKSYIF